MIPKIRHLSRHFSVYTIPQEGGPVRTTFLRKDADLDAPSDYEAAGNFGLTATGAVVCRMMLVTGVLTVPAPFVHAADAGVVDDGEALLASRTLAIPVEGVVSTALRDTFSDDRGGYRHEAIEIAAPRGAKVLAVDDGTLVRLFTSVPGGLTVYQFDPQGRLAYYYAHLDRYADGLREDMTLHRCDLLGYLGTNGNAPPGSLRPCLVLLCY